MIIFGLIILGTFGALILRALLMEWAWRNSTTAQIARRIPNPNEGRRRGRI